MYYESVRVRIMNLRCRIVRKAVYLWRVRGDAGVAEARATTAHIYSSHVTRPREIIRNVATWPVHYAAAQSPAPAVTSLAFRHFFLCPSAPGSRLPAHITNNRTCGDAPTLADFFKSLIGRDFLKTTTYLFLKVDKYILIFNVCFAHENAVQT